MSVNVALVGDRASPLDVRPGVRGPRDVVAPSVGGVQRRPARAVDRLARRQPRRQRHDAADGVVVGDAAGRPAAHRVAEQGDGHVPDLGADLVERPAGVLDLAGPSPFHPTVR